MNKALNSDTGLLPSGEAKFIWNNISSDMISVKPYPAS